MIADAKISHKTYDKFGFLEGLITLVYSADFWMREDVKILFEDEIERGEEVLTNNREKKYLRGEETSSSRWEGGRRTEDEKS